VDFLAVGNRVTTFSHPQNAKVGRIRGTGCALSAAIAAGLAQGQPVAGTVEFAEDYLQRAIRRSYAAAKDEGVHFLDFKI
jgi:hydroxymethylpyrimidine/phosphomethylpyrimidine kinase